ncbi:LacI family DNA-binding transcriptional regulator [Thalassococcus lentus]|uniref:LacI family DNA-binding transcriptional regulator n=1 Tax=Thalassococcus lentus TaxID=1210524 RepID=A0ABT4XNP4_9RHOB|nr:LacI family DNA-binding transcriptional regulator [Thalassococcus lentus]MDA7423527.1 LacI family DNA-binding transcriptional regulator [Thalassococcus lentus]
MTQKVTKIQDVARAAGVSTATVSRALSNPAVVAESTRRAVFEAVEATGYRVNQAARNLRRQRAGAILVLVPNLGNPFFSQILAGIDAGFAETDYAVLIADTNNSHSVGRNLNAYLMDSRVDGVVVLDGNVQISSVGDLKSDSGQNRVVFACEWVEDTPCPSVRSDNPKGARLAIRHLFELGHRKIAHVTGPKGNVLTKARRDGMLEERALLELPFRDDWIIRGDFSLRSGYEAADSIIAMDERPTAVFCASDQVALGLISRLTQAGIRVPQDISVVGFDDIEQAEYYNPRLTTIRQNRPQLGKSAAELMLNGLDDPSNPIEPGHVHLLDVELVVRDSTAPPSD